MSKKGISRKLRILVDTTFLLPALGIEIEESALKIIALFRRLEIYYLEIGILEAMWKILKVISPEYLDVVKVGLESIKNTYNKLDIPMEAYIKAYKIYNNGYRDYIDALYYSTAKITRIPWLTIDKDFIEFLKKNNYDIKGIVYTPEDLELII